MATFSCLVLVFVFSLLILLLPLLSSSEFTVVLPDSSALVDAPQTGYSDRAKTDPGEQQAVYRVMEATGNGWAASIPDVCRGRWHGIECMPDEDDVYHVVSLAFGALSDDTAFPTCDPDRAFLSPAVLGLPHLRSLFFYGCFANNRQPIPAFLGRLGATLRSLVLRENGHTGPIPYELGNLTSLKVLDLHGNALSSSIPSSLRRLTRLQMLDLSYNQLSGPLPDLKLPVLRVMDLSRNNLRGQIPESLGNGCSNLVKMDLSRNRIGGLIPDSFSDLNDLTLLDLSHNRLLAPLPSSPLALPSLRALVLNNNCMDSATVPDDGFAGLKQLDTLILSNNGLRGGVPASIAELTSLRILHLDGNQLNGSVPQSFRKLDRLSELRLNNNELTGPVPFSRETLWRMGRKLRLYGNAGLCYDLSNTGRHRGIDSMSGISYCDQESGRTEEGQGANAGGHATRHLLRHLSRTSAHEAQSNVSSSGPRLKSRCLSWAVMVVFSLLPFV